MNGLINLYKPSGISSAAAVGKVRRILGEKKVGHMGTLDPMAEGVLVLGVGKSTKLFDYLAGKRKSYIAKFKFGYETDTLDRLGNSVATTTDIPSVDAVLNAALSLVGKQSQIPPVFSAKHIDGQRAYKLARSGASVQPKPADVEIYGVELLFQPRMDEFVFSIDCSAGTYIRSICRDVAHLTGSLATLEYLQRTSSGCFKVGDSVSLDNLDVIKGAAVIPPQKAIDLPRFDVQSELKTDLDNGKRIECDLGEKALIYCDGIFYGIGCAERGVLKITTFLKDG
ncbi:MAG: tRNA pseudouridine(55) synthase TruB [Clostridiales bacterium]|nr:tRNA pseudouridine(55) synthase TruB [Clostridiales bacterium]